MTINPSLKEIFPVFSAHRGKTILFTYKQGIIIILWITRLSNEPTEIVVKYLEEHSSRLSRFYKA